MPKDDIQREITNYYNQLAHRYDEDRFGNSYGQYLHRQERYMLLKMAPQWGPPILSLGCGTGRLMELATHGADISPQMVTVAKGKYPEKTFTICPAAATTFADGFFKGAFCLHVLMHLPKDYISAMLAEANRIMQPGGWLVVDFPNNTRRRLIHKKRNGWHGNTGFTIEEFAQLAEQNGWRRQRYMGLLLLPIHRLPQWLRLPLYPIDCWLCRTGLKKYASYNVLLLQKQ